MMAASEANMDESVITIGPEGILGSSVLVQMGIKVNKPNVETRLRETIEKFNETYLEFMDFLTQILPLAREQFGRSDNLLLPKTPSKKRHHTALQKLINNENSNPNVLPQVDEDLPPPVKRTTRNSRRNNPKQEQNEPRTTRSTRGRLKKSQLEIEQNKVTFVDESNKELHVIEGQSSRESSKATKTLKRTSSTSPLSSKPVKKKSRSSDELLDNEASLTEKQTSTPVSCEPPRTLSLSLIDVGLQEKSKTHQLVNVAESVQHKLLNLEKEHVEIKGKSENNADTVEKMDTEFNEEYEPMTNVLSDNVDCSETKKQAEVITIPDTPPTDTAPLANPQVEPKTATLGNMNNIINTTQSEKVTNVDIIRSPVKPVSEPPLDKSPAMSLNKVEINTIIPKVVNEHISDELVAESQVNLGESEMAIEKCIEEVEPVIPVEVQQPLRRSKRLSKKIELEPVPKTSPKREAQIEIPKLTDATHSIDEPTIQDSSPSKQIVPETPETKQLRRSTRLSKRISIVSTGYKKRTSRPSSHFKKPAALKRVEVRLDDFGIEGAVAKLASTVSSNSEQSSTESDDDSSKSSKGVSNTRSESAKTDSSGDEMAPLFKGKVADMIQKMNKNNVSSMLTTPNDIRKTKGIGSAVRTSSQKPSNLVGGNVKSFIKRQSVKKLDASEIARQRKLELQRKEEKDKERKDLAEMRRKNWAEEQKRKREEKQKRVAEAKAAREREEQDKKQRQLEERKHMLHVSEQARKKREYEEEAKKRLREQRVKEAEARRLKEQEERLKKQQEKEEEERMHRDALKRKQDQEEQERKQRILEEKRQQEQKQRERAKEKAEERERRLREIKEKEAKRIEKEEMEKKQREEMESKEKENKERRQREQQEREKKRIAQLIKDNMEQEKKLREERARKEEQERREREEQRKREAQRAAMLQAKKIADSYLMTPPPAQTRKPATSENYDISDIRSDESTDDEDAPRKKVPYWAQGAALKSALLHQDEPRRLFEDLVAGFVPHAPDLEKIFTKKRKRFYQRTSSAHWSSPPIKAQ